jgi:hypothetical protein
MKPLFSLSVILAMVAAPLDGDGADFVYLKASAGSLMGSYQAYEANAPSSQYGRSISRFSPSIGIGVRFAPWIALEEEYDGDGSYKFDNVYAYPAGSFTEYAHNIIDERLRSAATRIALTVALSKNWHLTLAPGVEYQFLRQTVVPWQWYTVPFSLPQVVPDPYTHTYKFWRPDVDSSLSYSVSTHFSAFIGYRYLESPGKELSRISGGISSLW